MITQELIGKDLEGSGNGLIEVVPGHSHEGTEESNEKPQSGHPVFWLRFEPSTSPNTSLDPYSCIHLLMILYGVSFIYVCINVCMHYGIPVQKIQINGREDSLR
jgi:hypothetical protein